MRPIKGMLSEGAALGLAGIENGYGGGQRAKIDEMDYQKRMSKRMNIGELLPEVCAWFRVVLQNDSERKGMIGGILCLKGAEMGVVFVSDDILGKLAHISDTKLHLHEL